jgi:Na+/H+ antiporter NhaD/arsenite permease-like protein
MLVGIFSGIPFSRYFFWALPSSLVGLWIDYFWIAFLFRHDLSQPPFDLPTLSPPQLDIPVVRRILVVIGSVILAFLLPMETILHISPGEKLPLFALTGGVFAILVGRYRPADVLRHVDGGLLLFFASLFVVVRAVEQTGLLRAGFAAAAPFMGQEAIQQSSVLTGTTLLLSNIVSNVPFVLVAKEWMLSPGRFADPELAWAILAYVSTLAGNATILGSVANLIVLQLARDHAPIGFWAYARVGIPLTLLTTLMGVPLLVLFRTWVG